MSKEEFIEELIDQIYLLGDKENGKYIIGLKELERAISIVYDEMNNKD